MFRMNVCKYAPGKSISFYGNYFSLGMVLGVSLQFLLFSNLSRKISHEFWIFRSLFWMYKDDETFGELGIACYSNNRISKKKLRFIALIGYRIQWLIVNIYVCMSCIEWRRETALISKSEWYLVRPSHPAKDSLGKSINYGTSTRLMQ